MSTSNFPPALLEVDHVSTEFPGRGLGQAPVKAVDDVSLSIPSEKAVVFTIVGESGSGKTTLTRNLLGFTRPTRGTVRYQGQDVYKMAPAAWRAYRRDVQPVFQDPYATYNPFYRIDRVLELPIRTFGLASSAREAKRKIDEALTAVDLRPGDVLGRYPHQLSGGERQRLMLARVYLIRPKVIIADEPLSMIDASLRAVFLNILLDFRDHQGISCLHITHNLATAYYLGGEIAIMCRGRVVEQGDMDAVIASPAHPYTQQLIDSVPSPDPEARWTERPDLKTAVETSEMRVAANSCIYAERCPKVMDVCWAKRPEFMQVEADQKAACFLHGDKSATNTQSHSSVATAAGR